jgi:hypothetical protein
MSTPTTPESLDVKAVQVLEDIYRALKGIEHEFKRANDLRRDLSNKPETPQRAS